MVLLGHRGRRVWSGIFPFSEDTVLSHPSWDPDLPGEHPAFSTHDALTSTLFVGASKVNDSAVVSQASPPRRALSPDPGLR